MSIRRIIIFCAVMLLPALGVTARGLKDDCIQGNFCHLPNGGLGICGRILGKEKKLTCKPWALYLTSQTKTSQKPTNVTLTTILQKKPIMPCVNGKIKPTNNANQVIHCLRPALITEEDLKTGHRGCLEWSVPPSNSF